MPGTMNRCNVDTQIWHRGRARKNRALKRHHSRLEHDDELQARWFLLLECVVLICLIVLFKFVIHAFECVVQIF